MSGTTARGTAASGTAASGTARGGTAGTEPAHRVGFVFVHSVGAPRSEEFFGQIIAGLDDGLADAGSTLVVRVVGDTGEEEEVYRHWARAQLVDAVVIKDLQEGDPRLDLLPAIGMAFVALTDVTHTGGFSAVRIDNGRAMQDSVEFLVERGHRCLGRVAGPSALVHTRRRTDVFWSAVRCAGVTGLVATGDYTAESGREATQRLLRASTRPSAVVYDNDLMALGGLQAAGDLGLSVPAELSLLAWDDSVACQLATPPLSTLSHDVHQMGTQLARALQSLLSTRAPVSALASGLVLVERRTTGAATPTG